MLEPDDDLTIDDVQKPRFLLAESDWRRTFWGRRLVGDGFPASDLEKRPARPRDQRRRVYLILVPIYCCSDGQSASHRASRDVSFERDERDSFLVRIDHVHKL
jgi:hypothetical protein